MSTNDIYRNITIIQNATRTKNIVKLVLAKIDIFD